MLRWACHAAILLLSACFHPNYDHPECGPGGACPSGFTCSPQGFCERPGGSAAPGNDGGGDAPEMSSDASVTPDVLQSTFCSVSGIVACYEFEGNANDGSGNMLDATTTNVSFHPGQVGMAMQVDASSTATVNPTILVDVVAVTIEAWIRPTQLPANLKTFDILDVDQQYTFFINDNGTLTCDLHGLASFSTSATISSNQWTHVACTYDGATAAYIYINGTVAATHSGGSTLVKGGHGMGIAQNYPSGSQLIGFVDQVRLMSVARSAAEICADAGRTSCP